MARTELFVRKQAGGAFTIENITETPGAVYFVCSVTGTDGAGYGKNPDSPLATLDYANGLCTASKGDVIFLLPGHAETLDAASDITLDVAGISIIGLGHGSLRPTFTWSTTDSTIVVSAANVSIKNIRCTVSVDEVVTLFSVADGGDFLKLDQVDFFETASSQAIAFLTTANNADDLEIGNCRWVQATAAGAAQGWITLNGADRAYIHDCFARLALNDAAASATIKGVTTASLNVEIARNTFYQTGYSANIVNVISLLASSTGFVHDNRAYSDQAGIAGAVALANAAGAENYCLNTVNKSGILDPVADT